MVKTPIPAMSQPVTCLTLASMPMISEAFILGPHCCWITGLPHLRPPKTFHLVMLVVQSLKKISRSWSSTEAVDQTRSGSAHDQNWKARSVPRVSKPMETLSRAMTFLSDDSIFSCLEYGSSFLYLQSGQSTALGHLPSGQVRFLVNQ